MKYGVGVLLFSLFAAGCGSSGAGGYTGPLGSAKGKLTFKGQPLPAGTSITFTSTGEKAFVLNGVTDDQGEFAARWNGGMKVPVGEYKVSVVQPVVFTETDPDKLMQMSQQGLLPKDQQQFDPKYTDPGTSGLLITVSEGSDQPLNIELD